MIRIEIPPRYGWRVEFWWQLEQFDQWASDKLAARAGDPDYLNRHWWDGIGSFIYGRRKAAERRRAPG